MDNKRYRRALSITAVSILFLLMIAGCGTRKPSDDDFHGVWNYPEYNVRLRISEDNTWEMMEETGDVISGGYCIIDGDAAELYYTYGCPWVNEDGDVMYNVLHYEKKGKLSDGVGYPLTLTD